MRQLPWTIDVAARAGSALARAQAAAAGWYREHPQLAHGVAEMAIGAAILCWGVHSGAIGMGSELLGTADSIIDPGGAAGAVVGGSAAVVAANLIGSIGVVAMGSGVGVPVGVLALGGAAVMSAAGYGIGDAAHAYLHSVDPETIMLGGGALAVGLWLIVDGARRALGDAALRQGCARLSGAVLELCATSAEVVARTVDELTPYERVGTVLSMAALASAGGAAAGSVWAASTVTVLGSQTLGSAALGLGLVSAPVWPVVAGAAAAAVGTGLLVRWAVRSRRAPGA